MCVEPPRDERESMSQALDLLTYAIELLDQSDAPPHIAAHVDLAVHQLRDAIGDDTLEQRATQMATNAEPHLSTN